MHTISLFARELISKCIINQAIVALIYIHWKSFRGKSMREYVGLYACLFIDIYIYIERDIAYIFVTDAFRFSMLFAQML